jgi:signal transduction histidine kinase
LPIPIETHALIFEKFSRINDQDGSGAGLGLAICREIMVRLGGEIDYVTFEGGNRFEVRIPI